MKKMSATTLKDMLCVILLILAMIYSKIAPAFGAGVTLVGSNQTEHVEERVDYNENTSLPEDLSQAVTYWL